MKIYYSSLHAIQQQTLALFHESCRHGLQNHHLISHGFIYRKRSGTEPKQPVGKRVFCSDRHGHAGCGRTMQLYLDTTIRYLHYTGCSVVAFVLALLTGVTVQQAYEQATGTAEPRHAYRGLNKLFAQLSEYRRGVPSPRLAHVETASPSPRRSLLASTFTAWVAHFGHPLCAGYQQSLQRSFL